MENISFGERAKSATIDRANCADNVIGRAILLDPNPAVKNIAWVSTFKGDTEIKRGVEVTQEQAVELRVIPRVTYFFLIARLNTDMKGNVFGDDIKVEYLQLSANVYEDFCDSAQEMRGFTSIVLKKKVRKPGDTYGFIQPSASQQEVPKSILEKVQKMRDTEGLLPAMWNMVDMASSITYKEWLKILTDSGNELKKLPKEKETKALSAPKQVQEQFKNEDFDDAFEADDDFK